MPKFEIFLSKNFRESSAYRKNGTLWNQNHALKAFPDEYDRAGIIEAADLEDVFYKAQNLSGHWNPEKPCRSLSVGDIVKAILEPATESDAIAEYYIVAPMGFDKA